MPRTYKFLDSAEHVFKWSFFIERAQEVSLFELSTLVPPRLVSLLSWGTKSPSFSCTMHLLAIGLSSPDLVIDVNIGSASNYFSGAWFVPPHKGELVRHLVVPPRQWVSGLVTGPVGPATVWWRCLFNRPID